MRATNEKTQEVHGERKDMVEWQRGENVVAFPHVGTPETEELRRVYNQIAMRQHGPLANARGSAGILQTSGVGRFQCSRVVFDIGSVTNARRAHGECFRNNDMAKARMRYLILDEFLHKSDQAPRGHWKKTRRLGQYDMWDRSLFHRLDELVGEHVDRNDRRRFRICEEMRHFMRGVERIDVDEHAAGLENAEC